MEWVGSEAGGAGAPSLASILETTERKFFSRFPVENYF
jgi:hypothetical protein